jgi:hypothetical protein
MRARWQASRRCDQTPAGHRQRAGKPLRAHVTIVTAPDDRPSNQNRRCASLKGGVARVAAMFWIYWDTFWSLFFSAVWFMTIISYPDAEITDR